jgi:N-acylneuraminate cytidylyltransferase
MDKKLWSEVRLVVTDFDGVWTDGKVRVHDDGSESVVCSRKDTLRLKELASRGIKLIVITKETNPIATQRCRKMGVECIQGCDDKLLELQRLLTREKVLPREVAYVGDDINDLTCLRHVGLPITVADGHELCQDAASYVTTRRGGDHAMREILDVILGD